MRSLDLPQILYQPFAATGDKNTILNSPSSEDPQRANLQTGFPAITQIPIDNGGIPPERMDFNGLGYLLSSFYFFTQCGGIYTFNRNVSNAIGGYPLGAVLYYTDSNGTTYKVRSLLENNTFDFVTTPSYIDDEHWEYVSSTPITQDTSASSTSNVFSTAAVQSLLNTVVHKTGDETIGGIKTFNNDIHFKNSVFVDAAAGDEGGEIEFAKAPNSSLTGNVKLDVYRNSMRIFGPASDGVSRVLINADIEENKVKVPTPEISSNDNTSATTAYVKNVLSALYPVGSIYIGTQSSCPLATLINGSQWQLVAQDRALWGGNGSNANSNISAGLPNITGKFATRCLMHDTGGQVTSGALSRGYTDNDIQAASGTDWSGKNQAIDFDASRSNSIYGSSSTVQPPAYRVNVWRRTA